MRSLGDSAASTPAGSQTPSADDVRPDVSADDCDDPSAALTQAEWVQFCADQAPESDEGTEISSLELVNGEPTTFAGGEVVTVSVEPWTPPTELGGYPTPPDMLDGTYAKITIQVENRREVPIEISTMKAEGPYSPSGESWEWSLGWETRTADGPVQPGRTGVHEEIYAAPEGDPGKSCSSPSSRRASPGRPSSVAATSPSTTTCRWSSPDLAYRPPPSSANRVRNWRQGLGVSQEAWPRPADCTGRSSDRLSTVGAT